MDRPRRGPHPAHHSDGDQIITFSQTTVASTLPSGLSCPGCPFNGPIGLLRTHIGREHAHECFVTAQLAPRGLAPCPYCNSVFQIQRGWANHVGGCARRGTDSLSMLQVDWPQRSWVWLTPSRTWIQREVRPSQTRPCTHFIMEGEEKHRYQEIQFPYVSFLDPGPDPERDAKHSPPENAPGPEAPALKMTWTTESRKTSTTISGIPMTNSWILINLSTHRGSVIETRPLRERAEKRRNNHHVLSAANPQASFRGIAATPEPACLVQGKEEHPRTRGARDAASWVTPRCLHALSAWS